MTEFYTPPKCNERRRKFKRLYSVVMASIAVASFSQDGGPTEYKLPEDTQIVAIGDSYTSGNANGEVMGIYDNCLYSDINYANQASKMMGIDSIQNEACTGATPVEILTGRFNYPPQTDALSNQTDYVLLTTGANVVNISEFFKPCLDEGCNTSSQLFLKVIDKLSSDNYQQELISVYREVAQKAPNAKIFVVQYPEIFSKDAIWWSKNFVDEDTQKMIMLFIDTLNYSIKLAVNNLSDAGINIHLVPASKNMDVISNYGATFFTDLSHPRALGHPTELGYKIMAEDVVKAIAEDYTNNPALNKLLKHITAFKNR